MREMLTMMHAMAKLSSKPAIIGFGPVCGGFGPGGGGTLDVVPSLSADTTVWPCFSSSTSLVCWALVKVGLRRKRVKRKDKNGGGEMLGFDISFEDNA